MRRGMITLIFEKGLNRESNFTHTLIGNLNKGSLRKRGQGHHQGTKGMKK